MKDKLTVQELELLNTSSAYNGEQHKAICGKAALELIEYKKIEDELGIDLITFMKVRYAYFHDKQICFYKKTISFGKIRYLGEKSIFVSYYNSRTTLYSTITLKYKDYGKSWALTEEELL